MAEIQNFVWAVGEDLTVELIYKEGATAETASVLNLASGYSVRMDIVVPATNERIYTFNSEALADVDPGPGTTADSVVEGVLSSGANGTPNIAITVPRSLTLPPSGAVYVKYVGIPSVKTFNYDIFLRNTVANKQTKILKGAVTIEESYTLWQ